MRYQCRESNFPDVDKKIKRIVKKLEKHGVKYSYEIGDTEMQKIGIKALDPVTGQMGKVGEVYIEVRHYEFSMEDLKLGDYTVMARIEHESVITENGMENAVFKYDQNFQITEESRNADPNCVHCHTNRRRKITYILKDLKTGDLKQVGKTCLKEYTGITEMTIVGFYGSVYDILATEDVWDDYEEKSIGTAHINFKTLDFLAHSIIEIEKNGYHKASEHDPTSARVMRRILHDEKADELTMEKARKIIEFFGNNDFRNEFLDNIKMALSQEYTRPSGLVSYAVLAYENEKPKVEEKASRQNSSEYVGQVKQRLELNVTCKKIFGYDTEFGYKQVFTFNDENGNELVWKTTSCPEIAEGDELTIKGTIKEHYIYDGVKQTSISRVKPV